MLVIQFGPQYKTGCDVFKHIGLDSPQQFTCNSRIWQKPTSCETILARVEEGEEYFHLVHCSSEPNLDSVGILKMNFHAIQCG